MSQKIPLFLISLLIVGCSSKDINRHTFSHPNEPLAPPHKNLKRIVIASTNGFQQRAFAEKLPSQKKSIYSGGEEALSAYIKVLKKQYKNELLLLDVGPIRENSQKINPLLNFYNKTPYDAIAFKEQEIKSLSSHLWSLKKMNIPFINSNILDIRTGKRIQREWIPPNKVVSINGLKVGILSVSLPFKNKIKSIYFEDPILSFLKLKESLKKKGAQIIVLMIDLKNNDLISLIKRLPRNSIHAIVGQGQVLSYEQIEGIPIIQTPKGKPYISRIELFYDEKKSNLVKDKTLVHSPTKTCHHFFSITNDCHISKDPKKLKALDKVDPKLIPAKFLGKPINL